AERERKRRLRGLLPERAAAQSARAARAKNRAESQPDNPGYTDRPLSMTTDDMTTQMAEPGVWVRGPDGELVPDYDSTFPEINEGQVVHGTVVRVDKDEVLVDIGYKSEGVIPVSE